MQARGDHERIGTVPAAPRFALAALAFVNAMLAAPVLIETTEASGPFRVTPVFPVGDRPAAVVSCDLNEDGRPDIVTADQGFDDVAVLLNDGAGGFLPQFRFGVGTAPTDLACVDLNLDGHLDLIAVNSMDGTLSILRGNGDGTVSISVVTVTVQANPIHLAVGMINNDALPDIVVGSASQVRVLLGTGGFGFTESSGPPAAGPTVGLARLDADDAVDLVVARANGNTVDILPGLGDGSFPATGLVLGVGESPSSLVTCDWNGDAIVDLLVANTVTNNVSVLQGLGAGQFSARIPQPVGLGPVVVVTGDLDGDGLADLATANESSDDLSIRLGLGSGADGPRFGPEMRFGAGGRPTGLAVSDFDADGLLDLVAASSSWNEIALLLGNGDGRFRGQPRLAVGQTPRAVTVCDLDHDGIVDLASVNYTRNEVSVLIGLGAGQFAPEVRYPTPEGPIAVICADVKEDGHPDLVVASSLSSEVAVLLGLGNGDFLAKPRFSSGNGPTDMAWGDLDQDGHVDIVTANPAGGLSVLRGFGNGFFRPEVRLGPARSTSVACSDMNSDGHLDLIVGNDDVSVLLGSGDGTFAALPDRFSCVLGFRTDVVVSDFNGDGIADVASSIADGGMVETLLGAGGGNLICGETLSAGTASNSAPTTSSVLATDFDGNGTVDLVASNPLDDDVAVWLGNGDGTFLPSCLYRVGEAPGGLGLGDVDDDGDDDLIVVNTVSSTLSVLGNVTVEYPIAPDDFDGDGITDALDNCRERVNPDQSDFDGDGQGDRCDADMDGDGVRNGLDICDDTLPNRAVRPDGSPVGDGNGDCNTDWADFALFVEAMTGPCVDPSCGAPAAAVGVNHAPDYDGNGTVDLKDAAAFFRDFSGECQTDAACDDGDLCTSEMCINAVCVRTSAPCEDDGLFCNGVERCNPTTGLCESGEAPCRAGELCCEDTDTCAAQCCADAACADGDPCTTDTCNAGRCDHAPVVCGQNGLFCDGPEVCDPATGGCVSGTPPCVGGLVCCEGSDTCVAQCCSDADCDDNNLCTQDACVIGVCENVPVVCADDGVFCNGVEACDPATGTCGTTSVPCPPGEICCESTLTCAAQCCDVADCDDGDLCTDDACVAGRCEHPAASCGDDGAFCNGMEFCDPASGLCDVTGAPCAVGEICCEVFDTCEAECCSMADCADADPCTTDACVDGTCVNEPVVCADDGLFCNGFEACDPATGECRSTGDPCLVGQVCRESARTCPAACTTDAECPDDGVFCNGIESCDGTACVSSGNPCAASEVCDETTSACVAGVLISGIVTDFASFPVTGAKLVFAGIGSFSGIDFTATVDGVAEYSVIVPAAWSGTVTSDADYRLEPPSRTYTALAADSLNQNFTAFRNYYVDKPGDGIGLDGNDAGTGTASAPFATIQAAADRVNPGDTVFVKTGRYTEWVKITRNGTAVAPIRFQAAAGAVVTIDGEGVRTGCITIGNADDLTRGQYITVNDFHLTGTQNGTGTGDGGACALMWHAQNSHFENITAYQCGFGLPISTGSFGTGIALRGACRDCTVRYCESYHNFRGGLTVAQAGGRNPGMPQRVTIDHCYVHDNPGPMTGDDEDSDGMWITTGVTQISDVKITNCIVHDNADDGIDSPSSLGVEIAYNIAFNQGRNTSVGDGNGIKISSSVGGALNGGGGHLLHHNIVFRNARSGIDQDISPSAPHNTFYHNTIYGNDNHGFVLDVGTPGADTAAIVLNNLIFQSNRIGAAFIDYRAGIGGCGGMNQSGVIRNSDFNWIADGCLHVAEGSNTRAGDPRLVNPDGVIDTTPQGTIQATLEYIRAQVYANFALHPRSAAIDAGVDVNLGFPAFDDPDTVNSGSAGSGTLDYFDIGAIERGLPR